MEPPKRYSERLKKILNSGESTLFKKLSNPDKIQAYLDTLPINFRQTHRAPRHAVGRPVQCIEGALLAAAALAYHGHEPLLLDLRTTAQDDDHVVALFKQRGRWGAISKTNHAILRFRDPVYESVRELALSYFNEYAMDDGKKTLREFSVPFDLRKYVPERWVTPQENLWWLAEALDNSRHYQILPKGMRASELRPASKIELEALKITEWKKPKKKK